MLNIQMHFSDGTRSGWMFNVADSETNNGWGGDGSTQSHDSEVQGVTSSIAVYGDDQCPDGSIRHVRSYANSLNHSVSMANLWIRNNYLKITNDHGMLHSECHKCLFAPNGQPDDEGQENEDIYIGANRVVDGAYRAGVGLCSIKLRWLNH
ncbi:uncharacterized protein LOC132752638 [Ruditapes philippinarum]|uniref:uncharacterized protein LOC132752638 n=1 Tax=Ruditapes philippinarum TaxID=129788 RepID=UPI00295B1F78|nr:uncharacterized protein LOC132752638 [Ruditapes philippinarum]